MSDLAYHIATEHKLRFHEPPLTTTCSLPTCGVEPRLVATTLSAPCEVLDD